MGQVGAQHEPSMEEILASIRRIIESNEPKDNAATAQPGESAGGDGAELPMTGQFDGLPDGPSGAGGTEDEQSFGNMDQSARDQSGMDQSGMDHSGMNAHSARDADSAGAHPAEQARDVQTISLAEVAARVRATPDEAAIQHEPKPASYAADSEVAVDEAAAEQLRHALVSEDLVPAAASEQMTHANTQAVMTPSRDADQSDTGKNDEGHDKGGQLVSLQTGEQVAASFGELGAAVAAGQTRSFDEIAEDMLKPMLTQWLDDNLPTLVERLVREEIERVSRGNR